MTTSPDVPIAETTNPFVRYLRLGWSVLPLQTRGKLPESRLLPVIPDEDDPEKPKRSWKPYQTTAPDEATVAEWWRNPGVNVGIVTGVVSGIVVVDLDTEGAVRYAYEQGIPRTPTATTGKGKHIYFRYPEAGVGNRANFAAIGGFDLRGEGGYVVAPPSIHPSGSTYTWELAPEDADVADLPQWLRKMLLGEDAPDTEVLTTPQADEGTRLLILVTETIDAELMQLRQTRSGGRNDQLNRSAFALGQIVGAGLANEPELKSRLLEAALEIGLSRVEARATIASGMRAGTRQPRLFVEQNGQAPEGADTANGQPQGTQTSALIRLGTQATLFHSPTGDTYARYPAGKRYETHLIAHPRSPFRLWLARQFYEEVGFTPGRVALQQALTHLEQVAYFDGDTRQVFTRLGYVDDTIYLNLNDEQGQMVELNRTGWRLVQDAPVMFRSTRNAQALPLPERGGSLDELRPLLNLPDEETWKLCVGWMVGALHPKGPYAHLAVSGEQGSGKSSLLRLLRAFIDPAKAEENTDPRNMDDFMVTALNNHIVSYDNLSTITDWFSDALCRLSTGSGLTKRMLYSDFDEVVIEAARPVILNGIMPIVHRPDLLERTITIELPRIVANERMPERHFEQQVAALAPRVFGALLECGVTALQRIDQVRLPHLPRMADFVLWIEAAAPALGWEAGAFSAAFERNIQLKEEQVLEADEVAETMIAWVLYKLPQAETEYAVTLKHLLTELGALRLAGNDPTQLPNVPVTSRLGSDWPDHARGLLARLSRARPLLRKWGIDIERGPRHKQGQLYVIRRIGEASQA